MSEQEVVDRTDEPMTTERIVADLRKLGVSAGDTLLVHSSLSSLGWVPGGAPAVVDALMEALTEAGRLVMPTHPPQLSNRPTGRPHPSRSRGTNPSGSRWPPTDPT